MSAPSAFWFYFSEIRETIERRLVEFQGLVPEDEVRCVAPGLQSALRHYNGALSIEIERFEDLFVMIVSADGAVDHFTAARNLTLAAPLSPGWIMRALRPRRGRIESPRAAPDCLRLDGLRFAYALANERMVVMILAEDAVVEGSAADHRLARRWVRDLLGEEDFGLRIADARLMRHADWRAVTPGGRSWPLAELAPRFDAIFHPRLRAAPETRLAQRALRA